MQSIDISQAQSLLPQLLDAVLKGEEIIITREDQPVARIAPMTMSPAAETAPDNGDWVFGSAKGLIRMSDDFDEPLEDFAEYMP